MVKSHPFALNGRICTKSGMVPGVANLTTCDNFLGWLDDGVDSVGHKSLISHWQSQCWLNKCCEVVVVAVVKINQFCAESTARHIYVKYNNIYGSQNKKALKIRNRRSRTANQMTVERRCYLPTWKWVHHINISLAFQIFCM